MPLAQDHIPEGDMVPPPDYLDAPPVETPPYPAMPAGPRWDVPELEPCEKEILGFILENGCSPLEFDRDSRYYMEGETVNVAEFIDGILAEDDAEFQNGPYRRVYDEYFRMYDEGLTQEQISTRLLNSMDEEIATVAKDLLIEKHQITVKNYRDSLTAVTTMLVQYVPKALLVYQSKKVELILRDLTARLASETDQAAQMEIIKKISDYNKARTRLNNELGRV